MDCFFLHVFQFRMLSCQKINCFLPHAFHFQMFSCKFLISITELFRFRPNEGVSFWNKKILYVIFFLSFSRVHNYIIQGIRLIFANLFCSASIFSISPISYRLSIYFQNQNHFHLRKKPCSESSPRIVEQHGSQKRAI